MSIEEKAAEIARGLTEEQRSDMQYWRNIGKIELLARDGNAAHWSALRGVVRWGEPYTEIIQGRSVAFCRGEFTPLGRAVASHLKDPRS